jgi:hypothetical protein
MKRGDQRILTTHVGRLDGPPELMKFSRDVMASRRDQATNTKPS